MENEELLSRLKIIVKPYVQEQDSLNDVSESTDFVKDLKINSANIVDIILDIEQEFDIEIDNESMEKMLTVGAAMEIIKKKIEQK